MDYRIPVCRMHIEISRITCIHGFDYIRLTDMVTNPVRQGTVDLRWSFNTPLSEGKIQRGAGQEPNIKNPCFFLSVVGILV